METEIVKNSTGKRTFFIVITITVVTFLLYFAVMSVMSPGRKLKEIENEFLSKTQIDSTLDKRIFSDSTYLTLLRERAFLQSRNVMAATDSIYLTIDLADSSANLEISGVVVHKARMSNIKASSMFLDGDENTILNLLATPFTIESSFSTILKDPVMIKMAPKDTSEYKPDIMPDTSITEPVNYILKMTNGTRIFVYQAETDSSIFRKSQFRFDLKFRLANTWEALNSVVRFKIPVYYPYIKIKLPRADAKIIYRALPKNGQVAIYW
jgi:hypothetical protein